MTVPTPISQHTGCHPRSRSDGSAQRLRVEAGRKGSSGGPGGPNECNPPSPMTGAPNLQDIMPDDLRWTRYNNNILVAACVRAKSLQWCLTLCNLMNCSPPGSSVHRILQARILEWVAMPSSRGYSRWRAQTHVSYAFGIGRQVFYH